MARHRCSPQKTGLKPSSCADTTTTAASDGPNDAGVPSRPNATGTGATLCGEEISFGYSNARKPITGSTWSISRRNARLSTRTASLSGGSAGPVPLSSLLRPARVACWISSRSGHRMSLVQPRVRGCDGLGSLPKLFCLDLAIDPVAQNVACADKSVGGSSYPLLYVTSACTSVRANSIRVRAEAHRSRGKTTTPVQFIRPTTRTFRIAICHEHANGERVAHWYIFRTRASDEVSRSRMAVTVTKWQAA